MAKERVSGVPYSVDLAEHVVGWGDGAAKWQVFASGIAIGITLAAIAVGVVHRLNNEPAPVPRQPTAVEIVDAYKRGIADALQTAEPTWALEQSCLTLWANTQPAADR